MPKKPTSGKRKQQTEEFRGKRKKTTETQEQLIERLGAALNGEKSAAAFSCGGIIPSKLALEGEAESIETSVAVDDPVLLHYDDKDGKSHKIVFPASAPEIETLVSGCDAAK